MGWVAANGNSLPPCRRGDRGWLERTQVLVMAGLDPAIHALRCFDNDVDARDEPAHDGAFAARGVQTARRR